MSELKAYKMVDEKYCTDCVCVIPSDVYLKSEADKVIARLEGKLQNVYGILKETREWLIESQKLHKRCADNAVKELRHQKYKRCLAMARWCNRMFSSTVGKERYWQKWNRRWLELAEKFKEADDGND